MTGALKFGFGAVVLLYVAYVVAMIWLHPKFIYPFSQTAFSYTEYQRVEVPVAGDAPVEVRVFQGASGAPVMVYFMGNVGALESFAAMLEHHRMADRTVVAMAYRGGGGIEGTPSERQLKRDADAVMDALPGLIPADAGPVIVQGYSLGTGLALHVGARPEVSGILLVAPYARLCELMARAAYVPACWLPGVQKWPSIDVLDGIRVPVRILHGDKDRLIPPEQSFRLGEAIAAQGARVTRLEIPDGGHNDLLRRPKYLPAIDRFVARIAGEG